MIGHALQSLFPDFRPARRHRSRHPRQVPSSARGRMQRASRCSRRTSPSVPRRRTSAAPTPATRIQTEIKGHGRALQAPGAPGADRRHQWQRDRQQDHDRGDPHQARPQSHLPVQRAPGDDQGLPRGQGARPLARVRLGRPRAVRPDVRPHRRAEGGGGGAPAAQRARRGDLRGVQGAALLRRPPQPAHRLVHQARPALPRRRRAVGRRTFGRASPASRTCA